MDYHITDKVTVPPFLSSIVVEKVVWMPWTYQVNDHRRSLPYHSETAAASAERLAQQAGMDSHFVMMNPSGNRPAKVGPSVFRAWANLMSRAERAVLLVTGVVDNETVTALQSEALAAGLLDTRIRSRGRAGIPLHLEWQGVADVLVDTLVCSSVASASDALWQGTPMLTMLGTMLTTRAASSVVLASIGAADAISRGVVGTVKEYEEELAAYALL